MENENLENLLDQNSRKKVGNTSVVKSFARDIKKVLINLPGAFYATPTWARKKGLDKEGKGETFLLFLAGTWVHCVTYLTIGDNLVNKAFNLDKSNYIIHGSLYALPLITGGISKVYEIFRSRKQRLQGN